MSRAFPKSPRTGGWALAEARMPARTPTATDPFTLAGSLPDNRITGVDQD